MTRSRIADLARRRACSSWRSAFRRKAAALFLGASIALTPALDAATKGQGAAAARSLIRDSEIERTLAMLTRPIFEAADENPNDIKLFILNARSLNAFVAGGRSMFFHSGLLQTLETPQELMGVIAHETGHIRRGHLVRRIAAFEAARTKQIIAQILGIAAAVVAPAGAAVGAGVGGIAQRDFLKFTRSQESSADQAALTFLNAAGIDPSGMLNVLRRLEREQAVFLNYIDEYALTHPLSGARINALELGVRRSPALGAPIDPELSYWHARMRAKLDGFLSDPDLSAPVDYGSAEINLYRRAIILHRIPLPDEAIAAAEQLIEMRPEDPFYWELKGQIHLESGRGPEAVPPYRRATELAPRDALIRARLGQALLTVGSADADREALEVLEQAALEDPFNAGVRKWLADAYFRAGQPGMVALVNAEKSALEGNMSDARRKAERAQSLLPRGSKGWLRADDVITIAQSNRK